MLWFHRRGPRRLRRWRTFAIASSSWTMFVLFVFANAIVLRTYMTNVGDGDGDDVRTHDIVKTDDSGDVVDQWRFVKSRQILDFREKEESVLSRRRRQPQLPSSQRLRPRRRRRRRRSVDENVIDGDGDDGTSPWIDCEALAQVPSAERRFVAAGWTKAVYRARYGGRDIAIKQVNLNGHDTTSCLDREGQSPWECYRRSAAKIMKEFILLRELAHPNVLKVLGFCIPDGSNDVGSVGLSLVTELGESVDMIQLLQRSWEDRLRVVLGVGRLVHHLSLSPLGSLVMNDFRRQQFVLTDGGELRLSDVDDMELDEPTCDARSSVDCVSRHEAAELTLIVPCDASGRCRGHNEKQNIFHAGRHFVSFLLPHGAPSSLRPRVDTVVTAFANVTWDSERLLRELEDIRRLFVSGEYLGRRPDDVHADGTVLHKGFRRFVDSEIPAGDHDYRCQLTVSGSGCMLSVHDDVEAMDMCRSDRDCAAFVITPQRSWTGRHVVHFKNHFDGSPHKALGSRLYVKTAALQSNHRQR